VDIVPLSVHAPPVVGESKHAASGVVCLVSGVDTVVTNPVTTVGITQLSSGDGTLVPIADVVERAIRPIWVVAGVEEVSTAVVAPSAVVPAFIGKVGIVERFKVPPHTWPILGVVLGVVLDVVALFD
jgi:hypothetical protein